LEFKKSKELKKQKRPVNFTRTLKTTKREKEPKKEKREIAKSQSTDFSNKKALIAEDNMINQKLIKTILNKFGMDVVLANNGEEAVKFIKEYRCDIIFMDIQMPIMGGVEATKNILDIETKYNLSHIPIIALTANALHGEKEKYIALGMDDYLSKPIKIDMLKNILSKFL
jgi:CheY-like chemotaxis protein